MNDKIRLNSEKKGHTRQNGSESDQTEHDRIRLGSGGQDLLHDMETTANLAKWDRIGPDSVGQDQT